MLKPIPLVTVLALSALPPGAAAAPMRAHIAAGSEAALVRQVRCELSAAIGVAGRGRHRSALAASNRWEALATVTLAVAEPRRQRPGMPLDGSGASPSDATMLESVTFALRPAEVRRVSRSCARLEGAGARPRLGLAEWLASASPPAVAGRAGTLTYQARIAGADEPAQGFGWRLAGSAHGPAASGPGRSLEPGTGDVSVTLEPAADAASQAAQIARAVAARLRPAPAPARGSGGRTGARLPAADLVREWHVEGRSQPAARPRDADACGVLRAHPPPPERGRLIRLNFLADGL